MQLPSVITFLVTSLAATTGASIYIPPTANSLATYAAPLLIFTLAPTGALALPSYSLFGLEARHRKHHGGNGNGNGNDNDNNDNDGNGDNNDDNDNGNGNNNGNGNDNGNGNAGNGTANATADATTGDNGNNNGGRKHRDDKRGLVRVADLIARDNIDRELAE